MYKTQGIKNGRIEVADALRGLAVVGIILYHAIEHFNLGGPAASCSLPFDGAVFNVLTVLLSGKMYGIFALLFGLTVFNLPVSELVGTFRYLHILRSHHHRQQQKH